MRRTTGKRKSVCLLCFESLDSSMSFLTWLFGEDEVCYGCRCLLNGKMKSIEILGMSVTYLYKYEGYARECILRFKDGKDKWIAPVFMNVMEMRIRYRDCVVVYVPSSDEAIAQRGFKHNEHLVKSVFRNVVDDYFVKLDPIKQSERDLSGRQLIRESIVRNTGVKIETKKVLLFDDIITTGNSLRACYDILCKEGYEVDVLALLAVRG